MNSLADELVRVLDLIELQALREKALSDLSGPYVYEQSLGTILGYPIFVRIVVDERPLVRDREGPISP